MVASPVTSASPPFAFDDARRAIFLCRYWTICSRFFSTFRSSSWRSIAFAEFGPLPTSSDAFPSRARMYLASFP